jgi:hypothetical protein
LSRVEKQSFKDTGVRMIDVHHEMSTARRE